MTIKQSFDRVLISPPKRTQGRTTTNKKKHEKKYKVNYSDDDVSRLLLEWYESDISVNKFVATPNFLIPRTTFQEHTNNSGIAEMKKNGESIEHARVIVRMYLDLLTQNTKGRTEKASEANQYLTDNEEDYIYQLIRVLGSMGHGLGRKEILNLIDELIFFDEPDISHFDCSRHVLDRFLAKHPDLKNVVGASLCPQRASKATADTRDAMFTKLDAFVKNLHAAGYVKWKSYPDIPKDCIYNMDEVGTDTTKHRGKILCSSLDTMRSYCITPEGDGKMNMHLTCCLTSRADGKFFIFCFVVDCCVCFLVVCG